MLAPRGAVDAGAGGVLLSAASADLLLAALRSRSLGGRLERPGIRVEAADYGVGGWRKGGCGVQARLIGGAPVGGRKERGFWWLRWTGRGRRSATWMTSWGNFCRRWNFGVGSGWVIWCVGGGGGRRATRWTGGGSLVGSGAVAVTVASIVGSSIQPLQNLVVLDSIGDKLNSEEKLAWSRYHVARGFTALEKLIKGYAGKYATGDEPLLADVFLAPQIYSAIIRFQLDMSAYPTLARINEAYAELPAFQAALPERQPDAPSSSL